jgi:CheY-like chemotaxis protein
VDKNGKNLDRLIEETEAFLGSVNKSTPGTGNIPYDKSFTGKKVLIVDDDMRNIYALTNLFEQQCMTVIPASNGQVALQKLQEETDIDIILVDIMMPVFDGYQTMEEIKKQDSLRTIPIIALTAKAMQHDREKCLQYGACDYVTKPINTDQLLSTMKVWLYK